MAYVRLQTTAMTPAALLKIYNHGVHQATKARDSDGVPRAIFGIPTHVFGNTPQTVFYCWTHCTTTRGY